MSSGSRIFQSSLRLDVARLLLRIACAAAFLYHGSAILFGAFGGPRPEELLRFSSRSGDRWLSGGSRTGCGRASHPYRSVLRIAAACIMVMMIGAISLVHIAHGFDAARAASRMRSLNW